MPFGVELLLMSGLWQDTRLEMLLGDCQKEFQGGNLSTEKLGSKYGGYGTFLPTHARVPSMLSDPHPAPTAADASRPAGEGLSISTEPSRRSVGSSVQQISTRGNGVVSTLATNNKVKLKIKLGKQYVDTEEAKRKALYNGIGLGDFSDDEPSLDDDDDSHSRSNAESPEPSLMAIIEMMTALCPEGGLLSPLSDNTIGIMDVKNSNSYMHKSGISPSATLNTYISANKVDLESPCVPDSDCRKSKGFESDKHSTDGKKGGDIVAHSNGGRKSRRDFDANKSSVKERQLKSGTNENSKSEHLDSFDEKGMEVLGKEEFDLVKSSRKQLEVNKPSAMDGQKDREATDGKGPEKSHASKNRDSKDLSRPKSTGKTSALRESEAVRMIDNVKESNHKVISLLESRKQGKDDCKSSALGRFKENPKERLEDNLRKDVAGETKAKDLIREGSKPGSATKKSNSSVTARKGVPHEQKNSKNAQDKKSLVKDFENERKSMTESVVGKEEEKFPAPVEAAPVSLVVPQLVLDNWVACDKCETWRLLMPHVDPKSLPKKWRCRMMDWLPNMNNCKWLEAETTAAVYALLGYQNPALPAAGLPAAGAAPVTFLAPISLADPVVDEWAGEVDNKKSFFPKKDVPGKLGAAIAKVGGDKEIDGAMKSKNINYAGLDNSGDGIAGSDNYKHKHKEKAKRTRPSEGEDTRIKKKVLQEQERNVDAPQWSKESMDLELPQVYKERTGVLLPGETQGSGPGKRKKTGTAEDLDEIQNSKRSKLDRSKLQYDDLQDPSENCLETDKRVNVQKLKREISVQKPGDNLHTIIHHKETNDINSVLEDLRDHDGVEKRGEVRDQGRNSKGLEKQKKSKEDANDSDQRTWKKRRDDTSYHRPSQSSPPGKSTYEREDFNRSTSSKVSNSSSGSSGLGLRGVGSPLESTVSSSPVRVGNGNRDLFYNRVASGHATSGIDTGMQLSPGPKHARAPSRGSSLDEGEYRLPGVIQNTSRCGKQDSGGEARDDVWYDGEDREADRGHNQHSERLLHNSGDMDDDGQQLRRRGNRERDSDSRRFDIRDHDDVDHSDHHVKERNNARDNKCRPPRDCGQEKITLGRGGRVAPSSKDINREGDRIVSNMCKDGGGTAVGPADLNKRPVASSNTRGGVDRGEALKREVTEARLAKPLVVEIATVSPAKKEHDHAIQTSKKYMQDAKDLKHSADRLKMKQKAPTFADETESTNLYLQSALKFLQSAAILEPLQSESSTLKSMELYKDTAGLCEFCACQYKRRGDLRATALAYACAAVARTRLMISKKTFFANDCKEFQSAIESKSGPQVPSNGESPSSSSASDVDYLNKHHGLISGNKALLGKAAIVFPQVVSGANGTSVSIPARLRPVATRFLKDAQDMSLLLESWQKAADATTKAEASKETQGLAAVKHVGELGGLGDIDGVVRLVRVALDAIGH
uniref:CW-type domain-containing protein n=1 Tax=Physcomitrium patens TaxID=3218 RepID=A0A7I4B662_PHYPA